MTDLEFCERLIAMFGNLILDAMNALAEIEHSGVASPGGDVRVQGGVHLAVEEMALLATERLQSLPPRIVTLARSFRNAPDSKTRKYITALLEGMSGPALCQQTKIGETVHARMQKWLLTVVRRAGIVI